MLHFLAGDGRVSQAERYGRSGAILREPQDDICVVGFIGYWFRLPVATSPRPHRRSLHVGREVDCGLLGVVGVCHVLGPSTSLCYGRDDG